MVVLPVINHFRRHILQCPAKSVPLTLVHLTVIVLVKLTLTGPPKVANFQHVVLVDEQVFRFEVTMDKPVLVQEVDACNGLNEEVKSSFFREATLFLNEHKQVALCHVLHHQVNVLRVLQVCIHAHNVDMLELLVDFNFTSEGFLHLGCFDHALVKFLNGHFHSGGLVHGQLDLTVRSFPQRPCLKLKLSQSHVRQGCLISIGLSCDAQLASLDEGRGLLNATHFCRVELVYDFAT